MVLVGSRRVPSKRLGALKGNVGNQQYELPATLDLSEAATVIVWCRAFTVLFGAATLQRT